jgi:hypothetical protein
MSAPSARKSEVEEMVKRGMVKNLLEARELLIAGTSSRGQGCLSTTHRNLTEVIPSVELVARRCMHPITPEPFEEHPFVRGSFLQTLAPTLFGRRFEI